MSVAVDTDHLAVIRVWRRSIVAVNVDVIVNPANSALAGGGSTDGVIHKAAGPRLLEACRPLAPCPPGEARITPGFDLASRWVIHAVGPNWRGGQHGERDVLAKVYASCLDLASSVEAISIAFPAIATGAYSFPKREAAVIAIRSIRSWLQGHASGLREIVLVAYSAEDRDALDRAVRLH